MRFVIKIGTSLLNAPDHKLDKKFLQRFVEQVVRVHQAGHDVIIVSSGAVASGRPHLKIDHENSQIPYRQALAAVGQVMLMKSYQELFAAHKVSVAQALLTNLDFVNRQNLINTKNVFALLLKHRIVPIVNENDVTTIAELKFGDNDMLSAKTAGLVAADYLILLSDVDGLYDSDPRKNPKAKFVSVVPKITPTLTRGASGALSQNSRGGMVTKLKAAQYTGALGIPMFIAQGKAPKIIDYIASFCVKRQDELKTGSTLVQPKHCTFFP